MENPGSKPTPSPTTTPRHEKPISFKFPNLSILVVHFENCACVFKQYEQLQTFKYSFFLWYAYKQLRMCNGTLQAVRKRLKFYSKLYPCGTLSANTHAYCNSP